MKRFILSSIVIGSFILFSLYYRYAGQSPLTTIPATIPPTVPPPTQGQQATQLPSLPPSTPIASTTAPTSGFKDGTYTGDTADAYYGNIQVQATIQNGKISDIQFLQYPNDRSHSIEINQYAMPILKSEAIQGQTANVDVVSGATDSSAAFVQSLQSALSKAKN